MHDVRAIEADPQGFDDALARRGVLPASPVLLGLDAARREAVASLQDMQERRNAAAREIGRLKSQGLNAEADALVAEVGALKTATPAGEAAVRNAEAAIREALAAIPNLPLADVPDGSDETGNVERRRHGEPRAVENPLPHHELGEALGQMDFKAAARMSGARFSVLKGGLARLERALASFMLDLHVSEHGFVEVSPPLLVRDAAMFGTAQLPKFADDQFRALSGGMPGSGDPAAWDASFGTAVEHGDAASFKGPAQPNAMWLIPTAEVSLTNLVREQLLAEAELPLRFVAATPCFRAEAGSAGRDVAGLIRQHQFMKVEMVSVTAPERSDDEHARMVGCAEEVLKRLELPFRTVELCAGDMGFSARRTYDLEVWLPAQAAYREISSVSTCGDFQARRMDARYRPADGGKPLFVHTLNGSGVAVGRALVAVMENFQQPDGSIAVPDALRPYMGGSALIER